MPRSAFRRTAAGAAAGAAALLLAATLPAAADGQLRPLEPLDWRVYGTGSSLVAWVGMGLFTEQRAPLTGTEGRLLEAGNYQLTWRSGRLAVEVSGTAFRHYREDVRYSPAIAEGTDPGTGPGTVRADAGDVRLLTAVRVTPDGSPVLVALRFGTRLPTTDNRDGLDRDQTDFLATAGARGALGRLALSGELGIGLLGTRDPAYEQADLLQYAVEAAWTGGRVTPSLAWVGQQRTAPFEYLATESLGELRLGAQVGHRRWVRASLVRGTAIVSPKWGGLVSVGVSR